MMLLKVGACELIQGLSGKRAKAKRESGGAKQARGRRRQPLSAVSVAEPPGEPQPGAGAAVTAGGLWVLK
jgi:hypothetical protein